MGRMSLCNQMLIANADRSDRIILTPLPQIGAGQFCAQLVLGPVHDEAGIGVLWLEVVLVLEKQSKVIRKARGAVVFNGGLEILVNIYNYPRSQINKNAIAHIARSSTFMILRAVRAAPIPFPWRFWGDGSGRVAEMPMPMPLSMPRPQTRFGACWPCAVLTSPRSSMSMSLCR